MLTWSWLIIHNCWLPFGIALSCCQTLSYKPSSVLSDQSPRAESSVHKGTIYHRHHPGSLPMEHAFAFPHTSTLNQSPNYLSELAKSCYTSAVCYFHWHMTSRRLFNHVQASSTSHQKVYDHAKNRKNEFIQWKIRWCLSRASKWPLAADSLAQEQLPFVGSLPLCHATKKNPAMQHFGNGMLGRPFAGV